MRDLVFVEGDAETGTRGYAEREICIVERLRENLLGEQQRAKQFRAPSKLWESRVEMCRVRGGHARLQHGATIESDPCRRRDGSDVARRKQPPRLCNLHRKDAGG